MRTMTMLAGLAAVIGFAAGCGGGPDAASGASDEAVGTTTAALTGLHVTMGADKNFGSAGHELVAPWYSLQGETPGAMVGWTDGRLYLGGVDTQNDGTRVMMARRFSYEGVEDANYGSVLFPSKGTQLHSVAVQSDGKMLLAGQWYTGALDCIAIGRLQTNGQIDTSFGWLGDVSACVGSASSGATAMALQPDGKILVAGYELRADRNADAALTRFNTDGSVDTTFGGKGTGTATGPIGGFEARVLLVTADGHIVVGGNGASYGDVVLERFDAQGDVDGSFGSGGWVPFSFGPVWTDDEDIESIVEQGDGKLLFVGSHVHHLPAYDVTYGYVARASALGALDTTFGATPGSYGMSGASQVDVDGAEQGNLSQLVLLRDGSIIATGPSPATYDAGLVHFDTSGGLDTGMGPGGVYHTGCAPQGSGFGPAGLVLHSETYNLQTRTSSGALTVAGTSSGPNHAGIGLSGLLWGQAL